MVNCNEFQINKKGVNVESYFIKFIYPQHKKSGWIKFTFLKDLNNEISFRTWINLQNNNEIISKFQTFLKVKPENGKISWPLGEINFNTGWSFGIIENIYWELNWKPFKSEPLKLLPDFMYSNKLPTTKLITPEPRIEFEGQVSLNDDYFIQGKFIGMQGHNWGPKHSNEYVWAFGMNEEYIVEGFTTKIFPFQFSSICLRDRFGLDNKFSDIISLSRFPSKCDLHFFDWNIFGWNKKDNFGMAVSGNKNIKLNYQNPDKSNMVCYSDIMAYMSVQLNKNSSKHIIIPNASLEFLTKENSKQL